MEPPNPAGIDMRHTKLKASEAALLAGELVKPTWASKNEGIHERVSFADTLWGFEMAGGAFYKTPLRITYVKPGSRAEHACIRMGDTVLRISGRDTATLTLQEAHQLVLEAGINLKIVVTSPEDKVNAHYDYEDPFMDEPHLTPEQLRELELERVRKALERASRCRELPWPWVKKNWTIYRESNCFMVPSKYENKHRDKFLELPAKKLEYFGPAEKITQNKPKNVKETQEPANEKKVEETLAEDEEYEEVEEEVEEEEEIAEENNIENETIEEDSNDRLQEKNSDNSDKTIDTNVSNHEEELNPSSLETETDNVVDEESQRKDSNNSASSYELDNNNNHVAKHKDEKTDEKNRSNDHSDDRVIDDIVGDSNGLNENVAKTDDDIIDSVLSDNTGSDLQNER